ncbi:MAG: DUF1549 domain-containing protein, partial [Phycisphaeraceae bacterium]|nr:DUF1549 domain-containing protein [Phycisphaeraceae bacterium]
MFSGKLKNPISTIVAVALAAAASLLPVRAADEELALVNRKDIDTTAINRHTRNYWAYRPVDRPEPPAVKNKSWVRNPIDAFVLARLEAAGLEPVAAADKRTLIRRATYDLIGLPPSRKEVEAFVADEDPQAYEKLIDDLLARPQYGEKWGRHWLDLVRYAETNGYERDGDKPEIWRYRDYVIRSFNEDKPYNRFLMEQLAGDEMTPVTADGIIATGYMRLGIWDDEPADPQQARYDELDGIVSTTGSVMLGASLGCARCHDHKKDPIKQKDYYSLLAFFHNIRGYTKGKGNLVDLPAADPARISRLAARIKVIEKQFLAKHPDLNNTALPADRTLIADARRGGAVWRYAPMQKVSGKWAAADFKPDKGWRQGRGGFGNGNPPNSKTRTRWATPQIVLHKSFVIKKIPSALRMSLYHDDFPVSTGLLTPPT